MAVKKPISKSIRISEELNDFIESSPGNGFNQKLENALLKSKEDLSRSERLLEYYNGMIEKKRQQLDLISSKVETLDITIQAIFSLQDEVHRIQRQIDDLINDDS